MAQKPSQASSSYQDKHAYIPPHVQQAMQKQMEHNMPASMKRYAGAYIQQNMTGSGMTNSGKVSGPPPGYRPVTNLPRKDHFHQFKAQQPSKADNFLPGSQPQQLPQTQQMPDPSTVYPPQQYQQPINEFAPSPQATEPGPHPNTMPAYEFFMGAEEQAPQKARLPGASASLPIRVGLVAGGLIVLLIVFNIARGLLAGPSTFPYYLSVIQDQQEIIHLSTTALEQDDLSTAHKNFAATSQTSVYSAQSDIVKLLAANNKKIKPEQATLKVSTATDTRLTSAASSGTYNNTFNEVMRDQLKIYMSDLNKTYDKSKGSSSRALLTKQYKEAQLLTDQLSQASAVATN